MTEEQQQELPRQLFVCVDFAFFVYTNRLMVGVPEKDRFVCGGEWAMKAKQLEEIGYDLKSRCGIVKRVDGEAQLHPEEFWAWNREHKGLRLNPNGRSFMAEHLTPAVSSVVTLSMSTRQEVDLLIFAGPDTGLSTPRGLCPESADSSSWLGEGFTSGTMAGWVKTVTLVFPHYLKKVSRLERLLPNEAELSLWEPDHPPVQAFWYDDWVGAGDRLAAGVFLARNPAVVPPWADDYFCKLAKALPWSHSLIVGDLDVSDDGKALRLPGPQFPRAYDYTRDKLCEPCLDKIKDAGPALGLAPPDPAGVEILRTA